MFDKQCRTTKMQIKMECKITEQVIAIKYIGMKITSAKNLYTEVTR